MTWNLIITVGPTALGLGCLASRRKRLKGTTLIAPWRWCVFALAFLGMVQAYSQISVLSESTLAACLYLAATATFCPLMAMLGAKRPQNIGWQLIVVTLWVVLVLPVGEMLMLWEGGSLDVGPMRQWLFIVLLFISLGNYSLTRFAVAAVVGTIGQSFLLLPHLPVIGRASEWSGLAGLACVVVAIVIAWWQTGRPVTAVGWNTVWRDFRDAFGLVWSLRVMERVNATAKLCGWKSNLSWYGFASEDPAEDIPEELERTLRTLLRRFVSPEWISERSGSQRG